MQKTDIFCRFDAPQKVYTNQYSQKIQKRTPTTFGYVFALQEGERQYTKTTL
jgi:hypothetical protein